MTEAELQVVKYQLDQQFKRANCFLVLVAVLVLLAMVAYALLAFGVIEPGVLKLPIMGLCLMVIMLGQYGLFTGKGILGWRRFAPQVPARYQRYLP